MEEFFEGLALFDAVVVDCVGRGDGEEEGSNNGNDLHCCCLLLAEEDECLLW